MSNLSEFLASHQISPNGLVAASKARETVPLAERATNVARANARRGEKKPYEELGLKKADHLGRGVTIGTLQRALKGNPVPRLVRKKITRAVNEILADQKKDPVDFRPLFGDVGSKKKKKKA